MERNKTGNRKKCLVFSSLCILILFLLGLRLVYLMTVKGDYYGNLARQIQERERSIKAPRGLIYDRNGIVLASNRAVCTISVIHNQIENEEEVISVLSTNLELEEEYIRKKVEKVTSIERIASNVEEETGEKILACNAAGIKVDVDYKRYYPYGSLASKVLGFTGSDNQGIIGLEAKYDSQLRGINGTIYTVTDGRGREVDNQAETRREPVPGNNLILSLDLTIQQICDSSACNAYLQNQADSVSILALNPQNGEVLAMVDIPEFDLNTPFSLDQTNGQQEIEPLLGEMTYQEVLNQMWRNQCVSDTYEPGSTFKIITTSIALEENLVTLDENFYCPGYIVVEDRRIRCHKTTGHGSQDFATALRNSCNPVFITIGLRIGSDRFYNYFEKFGLLDKTGIDLPGEAQTIMHQKDKIGLVELATVSFGQSFQVSPIQMATTVSSLVNGGERVTAHLATSVTDVDGNCMESFSYEKTAKMVTPEVSETLCELLESVVSQGTGRNAAIEGYEIGGKTATSQTLPRSANKYIASFIGFYPANQPQILLLVLIRNPKGAYYGGTIAAPVAREIFEKVIPYLDNCE